jgi:hypothetical protein
MKSLRGLSFLILFPVAALAQDVAKPVITGVTPPSGPVSGGTNVVISGTALDLPAGFACILPCPTKVAFGEIEVVPREANNTRLLVTTPPHAAGSVSLTVKTGDGRTAVMPDAFTYLPTVESSYEAILLPVYADGRIAGGNGSQWETDLWLRNNSKEPVALAPWTCPDGQFCPAIFPLTFTLEGGSELHNLPAFFRPPTANPARLLYVTRARAGSLSAGLRIADVSRIDLDAGTEVPIVRERDLLGSAAQLHNIPFSGRFRVMLRIFETALTESRFRVRFYPEAAGQPMNPILELELTARSSETGPFRIAPAYAQYGDLTSLLALPTIWPPALRAEIEPLTPGSSFWTFASITNNDTQHVTLVTPE